jgi:hypothetical protein
MPPMKSKPGTWMVLGALLSLSLTHANSAPLHEILLARFASADDGTDSDNGFDNLEIVDPSLKGKITILRVGSEVGENKLLSVFAGLKDKTAHRLMLQLETVYKDKDGNDLNGGSWFTMALKPHEEKEYHSASISVQAVDFVIRVRHAPNSPIVN